MRFFMLPGLAMLAACNPDDVKPSVANNAAGNEEPSAQAARERAVPALPAATAPPTIAMPAFAPQYPASVITAVNSSASGRNVHEVTLETRDDASSIMAFYRDKFSAGGLKKTSDFQSGGTGVLSAAAKDRKAAIAITTSGMRNRVIVTYSGD
ncbi:hypothetical protein NUH86_22130 (plasmid) [Sphingobium sp. JS3065]|uniref:hypothetical protein n=1 Tax=Sphingobium sp. JS3065 TaxID=2970925 RepID=UPI0022641164|nr:hypothetical protein [Sphingobium sp. JS3065]UZW57984.1 hypothetical protein NUH86_22130 [Sphingobium sp. JS3065]